MALCSGIKADGTRCKAQAIRGSAYCVGHDPDQAEARHRRASKGGKRGGRGRPVSELSRLGARLEELAEKVLKGEVDRGDAAVAGQLLGTSRACLRDVLSATEEQLREQVEELEAIAEEQRMQDRERGIKRGWGGAR